MNGAAPALLASGQSGPCASPYTVKPGDTLSNIARTCGLTLQNLMAANGDITDPNLIHAGQEIMIFYPPNLGATPLPLIPTAAPQQTTPLEALLPVEPSAPEAVESGGEAQTEPAALPLVETPQPEAPVSETSQPSTTVEASAAAALKKAGGTVDVEVSGLPPNTPVKIGIGRVKAVPAIVDTASTDAAGKYKGKVVIPTHARYPEVWMVTVMTTTRPQVKVTSVPFEIQK